MLYEVITYFTVYGPRQRPDMAFHRFCRAMLRGVITSYSIHYTKLYELSAETRAYLEALPYTIERGGALLVHASPLEPGAWHYVLSPMDATEESYNFV